MEDLVRLNNLMHGYSEDNSILRLDNELISLAVELAETDFQDDYVLKTEGHTRKSIRINSRKFLESKFKLYDVPFATDAMILEGLKDKEISSIGELVSIYNDIGVYLDPFKVPVYYVNKPYYYGVSSLQATDCFNEEFLRQKKNFVQLIELSKTTSEFSSLCHVHEVMHLELERLKGSVTSILHSEVLSIFMELVYAYEHDNSGALLRKDSLIRLNYLLYEFNELYTRYTANPDEKVDLRNVFSSKYISSILVAFNLFDMYFNGDEIFRKYIMNRIQSVFDGNRTLEDILNELGISYDSSKRVELFTKVLKH